MLKRRKRLSKSDMEILDPVPKKVLGLLGQTFTRITVDGYCGSILYKKSRSWIHFVNGRCSCGVSDFYNVTHLKHGRSKSCGCLTSETTKARLTKHGFAPLNGKRTSEYHIWKGMKARCYDPNSFGFPFYGARGIKVCDRWMGENGFSNFLSDMGQFPKNHSIEREDVDGNYEPSNCKWIPRSEQSLNMRSNWKIQMEDGRKLCASQVDRILNLSKGRCAHTLYRYEQDKSSLIPIFHVRELIGITR